jgi:hypothetical protein
MEGERPMNVKLSHDETLYTFVRINFQKMNPHVRVKKLYPRDPATKLGNWLGAAWVALLVILAVKGFGG